MLAALVGRRRGDYTPGFRSRLSRPAGLGRAERPRVAGERVGGPVQLGDRAGVVPDYSQRLPVLPPAHRSVAVGAGRLEHRGRFGLRLVPAASLQLAVARGEDELTSLRP